MTSPSFLCVATYYVYVVIFLLPWIFSLLFRPVLSFHMSICVYTAPVGALDCCVVYGLCIPIVWLSVSICVLYASLLLSFVFVAHGGHIYNTLAVLFLSHLAFWVPAIS